MTESPLAQEAAPLSGDASLLLGAVGFLIGLCCLAIAAALVYLVWRRPSARFNGSFLLVAAFLFALALSHLVQALAAPAGGGWLVPVLWTTSGMLALVTALRLWRVVPAAARSPGTEQLRAAISGLKRQIQERERAERALEALNQTLEQRVGERTAELRNANLQLRGEIETRRVAEAELVREKERALVTLRSLGESVITTDHEGRISYLNPVAERTTGWSLAGAERRPLADVLQVLDAGTRQALPSPLAELRTEPAVAKKTQQGLLIDRCGREYWIELSATPIVAADGAFCGAVLVFRDNSESRRAALRMSYLAQHDYLTDLPNRLLLTDRLNLAIAHANRYAERVAMLFVDIDHFKRVNDSLGHAAGDELLKRFAQRLRWAVRASDTVSRLGGDEFVVLLPEIVDERGPIEVVNRLLESCCKPFFLDGHELNVTVSVGVALYPDDGATVEDLMRRADAAMYRVKTNGRNGVQMYRAAAAPLPRAGSDAA